MFDSRPPDDNATLDENERLRRRIAALEDVVREQRDAMARLRESDEQHRLLFEKTGNPIWAMDLDGKLVTCNCAAETYSGLSREALKTKNIRDFLPEDSTLCDTRRLWVGGGVLETAFFANGQTRYLELTIIPLFWNSQPVLFGVGKDVTERRRAEEVLRKDRDELERRVAERTVELREAVDRLEREIGVRSEMEKALKKEQRLLRRLLSLHEKDRKLMAYEIHDGFTQEVTGAHLLLEGFREMLSKKPAEAWKTFEDALRLLGQSIAEARRLISGLRPPVLDESGIVGALEYLIYEAQDRTGLRIDFVHAIGAVRFAPPLESAIFRIAQECLTNAGRHSKSDRVLVRLTRRGRWVRLEVQDWGQGFVPKAVPPDHFGVRGIRERTRLLGGRVTIRTSPGKGTHVIVDLPFIKQAGSPR